MRGVAVSWAGVVVGAVSAPEFLACVSADICFSPLIPQSLWSIGVLR
jgi:hypothetical protein